METSSRYPLWKNAGSTLQVDVRAIHVRIPGDRARLHISTAVMFTSKLSGVRTCNLYTGVTRGSCKLVRFIAFLVGARGRAL